MKAMHAAIINEYGHTTKKIPDPIPISEVKLRAARIVLGWETTREALVLYSFFVVVFA